MPEIECPHCGKRQTYSKTGDLPHFPFCSEKCRLLDLGGWLDQRYAIPGAPADGAESSQPETSDDNETT